MHLSLSSSTKYHRGIVLLGGVGVIAHDWVAGRHALRTGEPGPGFYVLSIFWCKSLIFLETGKWVISGTVGIAQPA